MEALTSLESFQALYTDLLALAENRFSDFQRLGAQLEAHTADFRKLLEKRPRSDQSRTSLATGMKLHLSAWAPTDDNFTGRLDVAGDEYTINDEFQQGALQLADELDLDELEAARIFLEVQGESDSSGSPALTNAIIRFHQRRKCLLDCLLLILQQSADINQEDELRADLQGIVDRIVRSEDGSPRYTQRCLLSMGDIKVWLQRLADKMNSASVLGQGQQVEVSQAIEYQRVSLVKQNESLGVILLYLVKEGYSVLADFEALLETLRRADKYDNLLCEPLFRPASLLQFPYNPD